ncbi:MAG: ferritin-like domain-containing protein [Kofleriaceae bacterium]
MRLPELRRVLQTIVLASLPAAGCLGTNADDCLERTAQRTLVIDLPTDGPTELKVESCRVDVDACLDLCRAAMRRAMLSEAPGGCDVTFQAGHVNVDVTYTYYNGDGCVVAGRRPAGLQALRGGGGDRAADWLARAAWLEAASVHSFVQLARELEQAGAPRTLVAWAMSSANDELRHATMVTRLALRYGATPQVPEIAPVSGRSLEALALENAVEGCVRETWGALLALWQSRTALDPDVRRVFAQIARDELRHAALAWAVDRWLAPQLTGEALDRVAAARHVAMEDLTRSHEAIPALGLPDLNAARALLGRAQSLVWRGASS